MTHAFGIDFGTTNAVTVLGDASVATGVIVGDAPAIVTPSVIYFDPSGKTLVGDEAVEPALADPSRAILDVRDWLSDPRFNRKIDGVKVRASDLATMLFERIASGLNLPADSGWSGVVTVPSYTSSDGRQLVLEGARRAGLPIVQLMDEPTAGALAYAVTRGLQGRVLVYALNHDFDATIIEFSSPTEMQVLASDGDRAAPGEPCGVPVERTKEAVHRVLAQLRIKPDQLDAVILTGERALDDGVQDMILQTLAQVPIQDIDPFEVVARGAAARAALLTQDGGLSLAA